MQKKIIDKQEIKSSSSANIYETVLYEDSISCNCPAGGKRSFCKHMIKIIHDNNELLQNKYPDFYKKLSEVLIMKNSSDKNSDTYKNLLSEIIYVNKEIAEKSHNNEKNIIKKEQISLNEVIKNIEKNYSSEEQEKLLNILNSIKPHFNDVISYLDNKFNV